jgi:hypothetical protein
LLEFFSRPTRSVDSEIGKTHNEKQSSVAQGRHVPLAQKRFIEMTIRTIPRSEFKQLLPHNLALENWIVNQVEWFSNRSGNLLGAIAKDVAGWNYVILERDELGDFYVQKVMNNFLGLEAARVDLLLWMVGSEKIARIDLLLSMVRTGKSACANPGTTNSWLPPVPAEIPR